MPNPSKITNSVYKHKNMLNGIAMSGNYTLYGQNILEHPLLINIFIYSSNCNINAILFHNIIKNLVAISVAFLFWIDCLTEICLDEFRSWPVMSHDRISHFFLNLTLCTGSLSWCMKVPCPTVVIKKIFYIQTCAHEMNKMSNLFIVKVCPKSFCTTAKDGYS